jgi:hypothetical protein
LPDDGLNGPYNDWVTLSDTIHQFELDWQAATALGADDGRLRLWLDGGLEENIDDVDNDTCIDKVRLGVVDGLDAGTSGMMYLHSLKSALF